MVTEEMKNTLKKELGDVLWYINFLSVKLGFDLKDVAQANIEKLFDRKDRNKLMGQGDDR
jgi:NTP pyrophosphatase (non-canonical NTP hydrolase)